MLSINIEIPVLMHKFKQLLITTNEDKKYITCAAIKVQTLLVTYINIIYYCNHLM